MCERVNVMYGGTFVETGSAEQVFGSPRHPYTLGLLQSVPRLDTPRGRQLQPIAGAPRDMLHAPHACPFQPRCRYAIESCHSRGAAARPRSTRATTWRASTPSPADEWARSRLVKA